VSFIEDAGVQDMDKSPSPTSLPPLSSTSGVNRGEGVLQTKRYRLGIVLARVAYLVFTGTAVFLYVYSLPTYYGQLKIVCPSLPSCSFYGQLSQGTLPWFQQAHISVSTYATAFLALVSLNGLLATILGVAIVWRLWGKDNELLGLLTSFVLILAGTIATKAGTFANFAPSTPLVLNIIGSASFVLYWPAFAIFILTFPTGRFAPRWTWLLLSLWLLQIVLFGFIAPYPLLLAAEQLVVFGSTFAVLFYRSRYLYTYVQRQQTKWLLYGFVPFALLNLLTEVLQGIPALNPSTTLIPVVGPVVEVVSYLIVTLAVGIAVLWYRLFDIDVLINRTLVYGLLTATLLGTYLVLVFGGEHVVANVLGPSNSVILVVSTLIVAALFQPLRQRLQQLVDRRFYRSKYNAAQVVADFGETLRQEVNLEQLCGQFLMVVQQTVQPTALSLWLRPRTQDEEPGTSETRLPPSYGSELENESPINSASPLRGRDDQALRAVSSIAGRRLCRGQPLKLLK
jgi:hypothetical protein